MPKHLKNILDLLGIDEVDKVTAVPADKSNNKPESDENPKKSLAAHIEKRILESEEKDQDEYNVSPHDQTDESKTEDTAMTGVRDTERMSQTEIMDTISKLATIYVDYYYKKPYTWEKTPWDEIRDYEISRIVTEANNTLFVSHGGGGKTGRWGEVYSPSFAFDDDEANLDEEYRYFKKTQEEKDKEIDEFLKKHRIVVLGSSFYDTLAGFKGKMTDAELYHLADVDRRVYSNIRNGIAKPSKKTAISLALALRLNEEETGILLNAAGYSLSPNDLLDVLIRYCIEEKVFDIDMVNDILMRRDLDPLRKY